MSQIRNLSQSVQDRDVTKQAPDIVVYLEGQDYLINPYLGAEPGTPVSFNDYVTSFQASYDIDAMVPTCTITLSVPNVLDHLFRMPGGNYLLKAMADIRVYHKGYYFSPRGNTLYHQVFRGFITSISYNEDGKFTNISLSCSGVLGLLERMQVDINPAAMSAAQMEVTPMQSTTWSLDPYSQIAFVFLYSSMVDGFSVASLQQGTIQNSPLYGAIQDNFMAKWQALLFDLCRDVHVFGKPNVTNVINTIQENVRNPEASKQKYAKPSMANAFDKVGTVGEIDSQTNNQEFFAQIRNYLPDMSFGNIQLLNGRIMSRLERLRFFTSLIGFEAYQDIDGGIIIKPPLFNLDCTNVTNANAPQLNNTLLDIYDQNNPFVVQLAEILPGESYLEDEAQVRATRILVRGSIDPFMQVAGTEQYLTVVEDIDIPKMAQFGLRTEPPIEARWFKDGDAKALFAYASTELARANRGFRTYNFTIPVRPELKLGFPMYVPHKDFYGYVKSVSINYTRGSNATMSVMLDSIRRRPMYPEQQTITNADGTSSNINLLTTQQNLVLQWSKAPATTSPSSDQSSADLTGQLATLPLPLQTVFKQEIQMAHYRQNKIGNSYQVNNDSKANCWQVQTDKNHVWDHQRSITPAPNGTPYTLGNDYYEDLRSIRPYLDQKGYEVIGTFPYGRWDTLKNCIYQFTIGSTLPAGESNGTTVAINPVSGDTTTLTNAQAFLFTGSSVPQTNPEAATTLVQSLEQQATTISNFKIFELTYSNTNAPSNVNGAPATTTPPATDTTSDQTAAQRANVFLNGQIPQTNTAASVLASIPPPPTPVVVSGPGTGNGGGTLNFVDIGTDTGNTGTPP